MQRLRLKMTSAEIEVACMELCPEILGAEAAVSAQVPHGKRQIERFQAYALYVLARQFNHPRTHILEIGTFLGYSAGIMAAAAPKADIVTLNPRADEAEMARRYLTPWPNVEVVEALSWDLLEEYGPGPRLDMIFVDGDHARVARDLPWFNNLRVGGLILFHDYTPGDAPRRPCPPVYEAVNGMAEKLGRKADVMVVNEEWLGLAGFYRQKGEHWL